MDTTFPLLVRQGSRVHRAITIGVVVVVALAVYLAPFVLPGYRLNQISGALVLAIAIVGLNLLSGFGGQISLGHAAFFGLGAYTTGILTVDHGVPVIVAMLLSIVVCFCAGVIVGLPALRLQGTYLALVTLAAGILFPSLIRRFEDLTGGSRGLLGISFRPPENLTYFSGALGRTIWIFWAVSLALALSCLVVRNIMRSRLGRGIVALRDKEAAGIVMGVNRAFVRTVLFGISAGIAGVAGGFFAVLNGIITPDSFSLLLTINLLVGMLIGGSASFWGPIIGGFVIYFVPVWSSDITGGPISGVLFGAILIATVFLFPNGVVGGLRKLTAKVVRIVPATPPLHDPHVDDLPLPPSEFALSAAETMDGVDRDDASPGPDGTMAAATPG
jgi:branched-chain amino acid transport system permease protein